MYRVVCCLLLLFALLGESTWIAFAGHDDTVPFSIESLKAKTSPLPSQEPSHHTSVTRSYFRFYNLDIETAEHHFGTFRSGDKTLTAHVFIPSHSQGSVILVHGYLDHSGIWQPLIKHLVERGYTVAAYDQPGHGLSDGEPGLIDDFSEYSAVLEDFVDFCHTHLTDPLHLIAHSMGAATTIDYLLTREKTPLDKVILLAPLVHSAHWQISRIGNVVIDLVVDSVPRFFRETSSDQDFLTFLEHDPLQIQEIPLGWFTALTRWNQHLERYEPSSEPLKIIQGNLDSIVDWEYNLPFLKSKFPNANIFIIEGARHHLTNEKPLLRNKVFSLIDRHLNPER